LRDDEGGGSPLEKIQVTVPSDAAPILTHPLQSVLVVSMRLHLPGDFFDGLAVKQTR